MTTESSPAAEELRRRILAAARQILREPDTSFDLRKVADRAGKSRTAPYLVFGKTEEGGGLSALRLAVAAEGYRELARAMESAFASSPDPEEGLHRLAEAYLEFARENRRLFRMMFGTEIGEQIGGMGSATPSRELFELAAARHAAAGVLRRAVESQAEGFLRNRSAIDPWTLSQAVWAMLHGVAVLTVDEQWIGGSDPDPSSTGELASRALRFLTTASTKALQEAALAHAKARSDKSHASSIGRVAPNAVASVREKKVSLSRMPMPDVTPVQLARDVLSESSALRRARKVLDVIGDARILWIDDRPELSRSEERVLESLGARVERATDTDTALRRLMGGRYHVIISDIERSGDRHAGTAALQKLQLVSPDSPVIFYVGTVDPDRPPPAGSFGITDDPDELLHLVLDALERRRS